MIMMKALVVNADESMRNLLAKFLLREGFEVEVAGSEREASVKVLINRYDIVIIDENIYKQNQFNIKSLVKEVMPNARIVCISPFYALNENDDLKNEHVVKCGDKLFKISELRNLLNEFKKLSSQ